MEPPHQDAIDGTAVSHVEDALCSPAHVDGGREDGLCWPTRVDDSTEDGLRSPVHVDDGREDVRHSPVHNDGSCGHVDAIFHTAGMVTACCRTTQLAIATAKHPKIVFECSSKSTRASTPNAQFIKHQSIREPRAATNRHDAGFAYRSRGGAAWSAASGPEGSGAGSVDEVEGRGVGLKSPGRSDVVRARATGVEGTRCRLQPPGTARVPTTKAEGSDTGSGHQGRGNNSSSDRRECPSSH
jgi:hypothetical protein